MKTPLKQSGISLIETMVVVAIIATLAVVSVPVVRTFTESLGSAGSVKAMISTSLSAARAVAAKEQKYAGIRFQVDSQGNQYMIFIIHDPTITASAFKVVEGIKPIKLPENMGVIDWKIDRDNQIADNEFTNENITDTTTFSIIFSPSGKLVIHDVRVQNDGDDIFDTKAVFDVGNAMFVQDDYPADGLEQEPSRRLFAIYDKRNFKKASDSAGQAWTGYLADLYLERIYINPYTGTMISTGQ